MGDLHYLQVSSAQGIKGSEVETLSQCEHFVLLAASFLLTFHSNGQNMFEVEIPFLLFISVPSFQLEMTFNLYINVRCIDSSKGRPLDLRVFKGYLSKTRREFPRWRLLLGKSSSFHFYSTAIIERFDTYLMTNSQG